jgi:hypothetical protein
MSQVLSIANEHRDHAARRIAESVAIDRCDVSETDCPAVRSAFGAFVSATLPADPPDWPLAMFHAKAYEFAWRGALAFHVLSAMDPVDAESPHPLVLWAQQTQRDLEPCLSSAPRLPTLNGVDFRRNSDSFSTPLKKTSVNSRG